MRFNDRISISSKRITTDEGFMIVPAKLARTGIQEYFAIELGVKDRDPTDVIRVYRPEEEVFSDESIASFANKPVTNNHPPELVTAKNFRKYAVGHSGPDVVKDGIFMEATLFVSDFEAIKDINSGKVEISNGYTSDIVWTPGVTPDGEQYDAVQRNIRGNHIALVDNGRCGDACKLSDTKPSQKRKLAMPKLTLDGVDFEASEQVVQAVGRLQGKLTDAEKKAEDAEEELKKKEDEEEEMVAKKDHKASMDKLQAKLDDSVSKVPTPEMLDQLVENRIATRDAALRIVPDFKWEGKDCETIRKEVVASKCTTAQMDAASPDYIRARFDMLAEQPANSQQNLDNSFKKQVNDNENEEDNDLGNQVTDARAKFMERNQAAWKNGGAA